MEKQFSKQEVKAFVIDMLEKMMPKKQEFEDFKSKDVTEAIEWGMIKKEQHERLVYLRAISEIDERLDEFVLTVSRF
jgi:hypothetical protein